MIGVCCWQQNKRQTPMQLHGLHTMLSCMVRLVQQDNSSQPSSSNLHSSSNSLLVLTGRQQALHRQHSHSLVSRLCDIFTRL